MIAQNILAAFIGLAVGVQAGPCKPSSVTTTTGTASTDITSITSIATSGEPTTTTTTEDATTTTSPAEYVCLKDPAPAGKACNAQGGGQGNLQLLGNPDTLTLASCYNSCQNMPGCAAFSLQPGTWCALWGGTFTGTRGGESPWSWYDMDCFCDESSTTASGSTIEPTTSSVELTSTTEAAPATTTEATTTEATTTEATTTTATAPSESCVNKERSPAPSDKVCDKTGLYDGTSMDLLSSPPGAGTLESCRQACHDASGCSYFAFTPGESCYIYNGSIESVTEQMTPYIWYDMDCFCDLDEPAGTTTTQATTTEATATSAV